MLAVHVGQAGCALGKAFWALADQEAGERAREPLGVEARPLFVDSEPKVARSCPGDVVVEQSGRGNCWAHGFASLALARRAMEAARRQAERCDRLEAAWLTHSSAGGTGSGLGSRLAQELRDRFPKLYLLSAAVAPVRAGETPLQHYNTVLCAAHLQRFVDGVLWTANDDLLPERSMAAMNRRQAEDWAGLLLPSGPLPRGRGRRQFSAGAFVTDVCPDAACKFAEVRSVFGDEEGLPAALERDAARRYRGRAIASLLVGRGCSADGAALAEARRRMLRAEQHVSWQPEPLVVEAWPGPGLAPRRRRGPGRRRQQRPPQMAAALTWATNRPRVALSLAGIVRRAEDKFDAGAYVHWYARHGVEAGDFEDAFEEVRGVVEGYRGLCV